MHAMVLENVEEINENNCDEEYKIGDHKLSFKNTYDSEEYGLTKKVEMNANAANAPKTFYYVHINVDLDQIADCTCKDESGSCKCRSQLESDPSDDELI